jgi:DNA-binding NtrC family response regulator
VAMCRTVLSVSQHSATQITRNLILERAGYRVLSTGDLTEAVNLFEKNDVHAVVLSDSISAEKRQALGASLRRLKPVIPIVMICKMNDSRAVRETADEQVEALEDPEVLLQALDRALKGAP